MKKSIFYLIFAFSLMAVSSCEDSVISQGRKAYKEYLDKTLRDPESLKIYNETYLKIDNTTAIFTVDYGAKNGFGAMTRETSEFKTIGGKVMEVDGKFVFGDY